MQFNCEHKETHSIQSYQNNEIKIDNQFYRENVLITATQILSLPNRLHLSDVQIDVLDNLTQPVSILLIGHSFPNTYFTAKQLFAFTRLKIGVECMSLAAACRTFNILLNDARPVGVVLLH